LRHNSTDETQSIPNRGHIDPVFKQILTFRCGPLGIPLQTEFEVSRLPRTIDAIIRLDPSQEMGQLQSQTPFGHFRVHNLIEFKGRRDPLTMAEYHLIMGRAYLYLGENDLLPDQMTVTIVSARKPRQVLSRRQKVGFQALGGGYYLRSGEFAVYLIVINELPILPKNYPLLLFTSSAKQFRQFVQQVVKEENWDYIRFAYRLRPKITKEVLAMAGKHSIPRKDLEFMAKDIGPEILPYLNEEDLLKHLSPEARLRGLNPEDLLKQLSPEDRVRGLNSEARVRGLSPEERLRGMSPDELRKLKQFLENGYQP